MNETKFTRWKPTWRLLFLLLLMAPFLAAASFTPWFLLGALLLAAGTAVVLKADRERTPGLEQFEISRHHTLKMGISVYGPVEIIVKNRSDYALDITLWDKPPATFQINQTSSSRSSSGRLPRFQARLKAQGSVKFIYQVRPRRRGDHKFQFVTIRWLSVLGLFERQMTLPLETTVKVYPNLLQIRQYEQLARLGRNMQLGVRQARTVGSTGEFEQLREYVPDDDYRRISWKATAKKGRPITVDFSPERSQNIILLIDISQRMMVRPLGMARTTRLDLVINAVLLFSYVALSRGDRVGLLTFDTTIQHYLPPRSGQVQLSYIIEALYNVQPRLTDPDYAKILRYLHAQRQRRSLIVLLTDPGREETLQTLVPYLSAFAPHHLPLCITLSDTTVLAAAQRIPYNTKSIYERAVAEQILDERQFWRHLLNQHGVMTLDVPAYQLTSAMLNKYLEIKERARI